MKKILTTLAIIGVLVISCKKDKDKMAPTLPVVTTAAIVNNGGGNITAGGSIVSDGGASVTKSGIAWSRANATPSITDSVVESTATTGSFTVNINGIDFGKTYYFRAFATNSVGTGYGSVVTLTTSSDSVRFTYNGQSVTYGIITSPASGKKWMDRNLGAKRQATAFDDYQGYGDHFQWGRPADGHQLINWTSSTVGTPVNGTTTVLATSDIPGHSNFINATASSSLDWRNDNNSNRWKTVSQGPCPAGWHVPSINEWLAEVSKTKGGTAESGGMTDRVTAYSQLKLSVAGYRRGYGSDAGKFHRVTDMGRYWSSLNQIGFGGESNGMALEFGTNYVQKAAESKSVGLCVRCIKD